MTRDRGRDDGLTIAEAVAAKFKPVDSSVGAEPIETQETPWQTMRLSEVRTPYELAVAKYVRGVLGLGTGGERTVHVGVYDPNEPWMLNEPDRILASVQRNGMQRVDLSVGDNDPTTQTGLVVNHLNDEEVTVCVFAGGLGEVSELQAARYLENLLLARAYNLDAQAGRVRREPEPVKLGNFVTEPIERIRAQINGPTAEKLEERLSKMRRGKTDVEYLRALLREEVGFKRKAKNERVEIKVELPKLEKPQVAREVALVDGRSEVIEPTTSDVLMTETEAKGMDVDLARMMAEVYGGRSAVENALTRADEETIHRCNEMWREQTNPSFIRTMMAGLDWRTELTANAILASIASVSGVVLSPVLVNAGLLEFSLNPHPAVVGLVGGFLLAEASMVIMAVFRLVNRLDDYDRSRLADKYRISREIVDFLVDKNRRYANSADDAGEKLNLASRENDDSSGSTRLRQRQMVAGR